MKAHVMVRILDEDGDTQAEVFTTVEIADPRDGGDTVDRINVGLTAKRLFDTGVRAMTAREQFELPGVSRGRN